MRIGFHVSIAGGLVNAIPRARQTGCSTIQIFSHSPRVWKIPPLSLADAEEFKKAREEAGIFPVFVHTSYLITLATLNKELREKSILSLKTELMRADLIGAEYVVAHLGSAGGMDVVEAIREISDSLHAVYDGIKPMARLLIENTSGEAGDVGSRFEEIAALIDFSGLDLGVTIDTCHSFGAGYEFRTADGLNYTVQQMENTFGLERVRLIHLNDSKHPLGSLRDRHQDIGLGHMGPEAFRLILGHPKLRDIPFIMETPKKTIEDDKRNMEAALSLMYDI